MSITINGATNTLTAASGLNIAGNTAVTGTLSATGAITSNDGTVAMRAIGFVDTGYIGTTSNHPVAIQVNNSTIAAVTSSGLAVTGTLSTEKAADNELLVKSTGAGGAGNTRLRLYSTTASTPYDWYVQGDANGTLRFYDAQGGAERANISSTALTLGSGVNLVMASGKGIDFSATSNGSGTTTSEVLSDYEEGTWTPAYSTTGGSFTYDTYTGGTYTKVGRLVTVQGSIQTVTATVGTGAVLVTGLPFTAGNEGVASRNGVGIGYVQTFAGDYPSEGIVFEGTTHIQLYYRATSNGASIALDGTDLTAGAGNQIMFSATYFV